MPAPAEAGQIGGKYIENLKSYGGAGIHGDITANAEHVWTAAPLNFGGQFWGFEDKIKETEKAGANNDRLTIKGKVQHLKKAHNGELEPNPNKLAFEIVDAEAGKKGELSKKGLNFVADQISVTHNKHFDTLAYTAMFLVSDDKKEILAYQFTIQGEHTEDKPIGAGCKIKPDEQLPANIFGSSALLVDPHTGGLGLSLAVSNISLGDVVEAQIRLGSPDTPGPIVFPLNPGAFEAVDGGVARFVDDAQFPLGNVDDLLSNNTFVEIVTPSGSLRGQCLAQAVGGTTELVVDVGEPAAERGTSAGDHTAPVAAAVAAGAVLALAAGGWYARRRFRHRRIS